MILGVEIISDQKFKAAIINAIKDGFFFKNVLQEWIAENLSRDIETKPK